MITPSASSVAASTRMRANRRRDTQPELALRRLLHARGLRYRVDYPVLPRRRADIVFPRRRLAIYVDGCFWHGCPRHATQAKANAGFWQAKIAANRQRDATTCTDLHSSGWTVLRFWEHEDPSTAADEIERFLTS
ncbi:MAG: mismatch endonuclease, patch repair protein [Actinomycetota bacterium]|jgi:DNA mismatch endonuclease (patch repair protein)|nr:mismatch endonuclease, patch repair protein [Actinomycetota bacterium]